MQFIRECSSEACWLRLQTELPAVYLPIQDVVYTDVAKLAGKRRERCPDHPNIPQAQPRWIRFWCYKNLRQKSTNSEKRFVFVIKILWFVIFYNPIIQCIYPWLMHIILFNILSILYLKCRIDIFPIAYLPPIQMLSGSEYLGFVIINHTAYADI